MKHILLIALLSACGAQTVYTHTGVDLGTQMSYKALQARCDSAEYTELDHFIDGLGNHLYSVECTWDLSYDNLVYTEVWTAPIDDSNQYDLSFIYYLKDNYTSGDRHVRK